MVWEMMEEMVVAGGGDDEAESAGSDGGGSEDVHADRTQALGPQLAGTSRPCIQYHSLDPRSDTGLSL